MLLFTSRHAAPCVCSLQKLLHRAEEEKSELALHIAAQEKQFKGVWVGMEHALLW